VADDPEGDSSIKKLFFIPDTHRPYHHKRHWALCLKALQTFKPDAVYVGGDFWDFYCVSDHDKNPTRSSRLDFELRDGEEGLDEIRQAAGNKASIDFTEGNHENRLDRYLSRKAPELFGMCRLADLIDFNKRGIRFHPYRKHLTVGKLHVTHDVGSAGRDAHLRAQALSQGNIVINHTHRIGYAVVGNVLGKPHVGAMFGHLSDVDQIDYAHRIQVARDWAYGFGYGYQDENGNVYLQPCPIVCNKVVIDGRVVKG
jgi:predicted phosphodiesterase